MVVGTEADNVGHVVWAIVRRTAEKLAGLFRKFSFALLIIVVIDLRNQRLQPIKSLMDVFR